MSLRDTILDADDIRTSDLEIPEWGVTVRVKGMSGRERMRLVEATQAKTREHFYSDILISLVVDPDTGEKIFDPADRDRLADKSGAALERIAQEAIRLSGVSVDEAEERINADPT